MEMDDIEQTLEDFEKISKIKKHFQTELLNEMEKTIMKFSFYDEGDADKNPDKYEGFMECRKWALNYIERLSKHIRTDYSK